MTDLLDKPVAEIKAADISADDARRLLAAEEAGKTRKGVIAHLKGVIAAAEPGDRYLVTAKGAARIQRRQGEFYSEGDEVDGDPEALADLLQRGLVRRG